MYSASELLKIALTDMTAPFAFVCLVLFGGFFVWLIVLRVNRTIDKSAERDFDLKVIEKRQLLAKPISQRINEK